MPSKPYLELDNERVFELELAQRPFLIGRNPANEIVLSNDAISREHARVYSSDNAFLVEDCGSRNGTLLNGKLIRGPRTLHDGDVIGICNRELVFRAKPEPDDSSISVDSSLNRHADFKIQPDRSDHSSVMAEIDFSSAPHPEFQTDRKLQALLEIAQKLSSTVHLIEIFDGTLDCLFRVFDQADRGFVILKDENDQPIPFAMKLRNEEPGKEIEISQTIVDRVIGNGQALLSSDIADDQRFPDTDSIANLSLRSIICAPLLNSLREPIGLIQIDSLRPAVAFQNDDLELLSAAAIQCSLALGNARLLEESVASAQLKKDLEMANEVQKSLLPATRPYVKGYEFYDYYKPANQVGGDYFDYIWLANNKLAIVIADVVGHGVAAALLMSKLASETHIAFTMNNDISSAMQLLNHRMSTIPPDKFVTLVVAVLDPQNNTLQVANAGHAQPLIRRSNGDLFEPDESLVEVPLAVLDEGEFQHFVVDLLPGDVVLLYTDGLTESTNANNEEYSTGRVKEKFAMSEDCDPVMVAGQIIGDMNDFVGEASQLDDICVVAFGRAFEDEQRANAQATLSQGDN